MKSVCIIIPSLNSPIIAQVITAIESQSVYDKIEQIIVVGQDRGKKLPKNAKISFVETQQPVSAGAARNLGIAANASEILVFLDSDCLPQPGWLQAHLNAISDGADVVGGGVVPGRHRLLAQSLQFHIVS